MSRVFMSIRLWGAVSYKDCGECVMKAQHTSLGHSFIFHIGARVFHGHVDMIEDHVYALESRAFGGIRKLTEMEELPPTRVYITVSEEYAQVYHELCEDLLSRMLEPGQVGFYCVKCACTRIYDAGYIGVTDHCGALMRRVERSDV